MLVNKWVLQALQLIFTCVEKSAFISDLSHISRVKIACRVKKKKKKVDNTDDIVKHRHKHTHA